MKEFKSITRDTKATETLAKALGVEDNVLLLLAELNQKKFLSARMAQYFFRRICAKVIATKMPFTLLDTGKGLAFILDANLMEVLKSYDTNGPYQNVCAELKKYISSLKGYAVGYVKAAKESNGSPLREIDSRGVQFDVLEILQSGLKTSGTLKKTTIDKKVEALMPLTLTPRNANSPVLPRWKTAQDVSYIHDFENAYDYLEKEFTGALRELVQDFKDSDGALTFKQQIHHAADFKATGGDKNKLKQNINICKDAFLHMKDMDELTEEKEENVEYWETVLKALFQKMKAEEPAQTVVVNKDEILEEVKSLSQDIYSRLEALEKQHEEGQELNQEDYMDLLGEIKFYSRQCKLYQELIAGEDSFSQTIVAPVVFAQQMATLRMAIEKPQEQELIEQYAFLKSKAIDLINEGNWNDLQLLEDLKGVQIDLERSIRLEKKIAGVEDSKKKEVLKLVLAAFKTIGNVQRGMASLEGIFATYTSSSDELYQTYQRFKNNELEHSLGAIDSVMTQLKLVQKSWVKLDNRYEMLELEMKNKKEYFQDQFEQLV